MGIRFSLLATPCVLGLLACGAPSEGGAIGGQGSMGAPRGGSGASDPFGNSSVMPQMPKGGGSAMRPLPMDEQPASCGATTVAAEEVVVEEEVEVETEVTVAKPVALYIMFDKSLSMQMSGLWDPAVSAMDSFLSADASKGLRVGLQYFPNGGSCSNGNGYKTPAVEVAELPAHAGRLHDSLAGRESRRLRHADRRRAARRHRVLQAAPDRRSRRAVRRGARDRRQAAVRQRLQREPRRARGHRRRRAHRGRDHVRGRPAGRGLRAARRDRTGRAARPTAIPRARAMRATCRRAPASSAGARARSATRS